MAFQLRRLSDGHGHKSKYKHKHAQYMCCVGTLMKRVKAWKERHFLMVKADRTMQGLSVEKKIIALSDGLVSTLQHAAVAFPSYSRPAIFHIYYAHISNLSPFHSHTSDINWPNSRPYRATAEQEVHFNQHSGIWVWAWNLRGQWPMTKCRHPHTAHISCTHYQSVFSHLIGDLKAPEVKASFHF